MASLLEKLVQTIEKDFKDINENLEGKSQRKELNMLRARIESAKKLAVSEPVILTKLEQISAKIS